MAKKAKSEVIARGKRIRQIRKERLKKELEELNEVSKSSKKSKIFNIVFILVVTIGILAYMIIAEGLDNIINILKNADYKWMLVGLAIVLIEWTLETIIMHIPLKKIKKDLKFWVSFRVNLIGKLFNNLTPFSTGGQPFQAYSLSKYGLRASDTISILMTKFIVYELNLFTWIIILLATNFSFFNQIFGNYIILVVLGCCVNFAAMSFILFSGINKNFIIKVVKGIIKLISKIRIRGRSIIKDIDSLNAKAEESISNYNEQFREMKNQKGTLIKMYIVGMLQVFMFLSIPFAIYKAFENTGTSFIQVVTVEAYLLVMMSFIPTPGCGLGAEGGFALFFNTIFTNGLYLGILFWRIFTFYLPIVVGPFAFMSIHRKKIDEEEIE